MKAPEIVKLAQFAVSMYTTLICVLLFLHMFYRNESAMGRKKLKWGIYAYTTSVCIWLSLTFYIAFPSVYNCLAPVVLFLFMMVYVMYYRFIFELTRINDTEQFAPVRYFLPVTALVVMVVWCYFMPPDVQHRLVNSDHVNKLFFLFCI